MKKIEFFKKDMKPIVNDCIYKTSDYSYFVFLRMASNCKHCHIDYVGTLIAFINQKPALSIKNLDKIFSHNAKITFGITAKSILQVEFLQTYYTLIACTEIPTGYSGAFQYHCVFFTNANCREIDRYKKRFKKIEEEKKRKEEKKDNLLNNKVLDKIMSYKSKYYLKKYIKKKLIS